LLCGWRHRSLPAPLPSIEMARGLPSRGRRSRPLARSQWDDVVVSHWWTGRLRRAVLIAAFVAVFAVAGLFWVSVTGTGLTNGNCADRPGAPGVRLRVPCHAWTSWGWVVFGLALGALFGAVLAFTLIRIARVRGRHLNH
jgi:hypothetical protein